MVSLSGSEVGGISSITIPYGQKDAYSLYFRTSDSPTPSGGGWKLDEVDLSDNILDFDIIMRKNNMSSATFRLADINTTEKTYVAKDNIFLFFVNNKLVLKGKLTKVDYDSNDYANVEGFGMEFSLTAESTDRSSTYRFINNDVRLIVGTITDDVFDVNFPDASYPALSLRSENENRLRAINAVATKLGYNWYMEHGVNPYTQNRITFSSTRGNANTYTFNISGASANIEISNKTTDIEQMGNDVTYLGYGDGINQLKTRNFHATTNRSFLNVNSSGLAVGTTTIVVDDSSSFPISNGSFWIGAELVTYGVNGNDGATTFTNCTRWATGSLRGVTDANEMYIHYADVEVYDAQYGITNPQTGSSIQSNGLKQPAPFTDRSIIDMDTLDRLAYAERNNRNSPIIRIKSKPSSVFECIDSINLGDTVTVNDAEAVLTTTYEIVGMEFRMNEGIDSFELELSNTPFDYSEETVTYVNNALKKLDVFMQGATNIDSLSITEDCPAGVPAQLFFDIPSEAVALNAVKLNIRCSAPYLAISSGATSSAAASADTAGEITLTKDTTWTNIGSLAIGAVNTGSVAVTVNLSAGYSLLSDTASIYLRAKVGTGGTFTYYPVNDVSDATQYEIKLADDDRNQLQSDEEATLTASATFLIPQNCNGLTITIQGKLKNVTSIPTVWAYGMMQIAEATHSHTITAGSFPTSAGDKQIAVQVTNDATTASPSWTTVSGSPFTVAEGVPVTEINLLGSTLINSVGWKGVQITPVGAMKVSAHVTTQVFIKSS